MRGVDALRAREARLVRLQDEIACQLRAVRNALLMLGDEPIPEGPVRYPYSDAELRAAHALHQRGERSPWVDEGERAYKREHAYKLNRLRGVPTRARRIA